MSLTSNPGTAFLIAAADKNPTPAPRFLEPRHHTPAASFLKEAGLIRKCFIATHHDPLDNP